MIKTILFDVGGTLENFWCDESVRQRGVQRLREEFEKAGMPLTGTDEEILKEFDDDRDSYRHYRKLHDEVELSPEEIARRFLFIKRDFDREKLAAMGEIICRIWEDDFYTRVVRHDILKSCWK